MAEAGTTGPGLVLFDGRFRVHYGQFYVLSGDQFVSDPDEANAGQVNGLCGAAVPGALFMTTGLHTGDVGLVVERHDEEPMVDDSWEGIVEASFVPGDSEVSLVQWASEGSWPLDLPARSYRVRYCATGMDAGRETDVVMEDEPLVDRYLLRFWPADPAPDVVVKQTSPTAAHWHQAWRSRES